MALNNRLMTAQIIPMMFSNMKITVTGRAMVTYSSDGTPSYGTPSVLTSDTTNISYRPEKLLGNYIYLAKKCPLHQTSVYQCLV